MTVSQEAAAILMTPLAPDWILSLDADEQIDPADGAALGLGAVPRRVTTISQHVAAWGGELRTTYQRAKPLVIAGAIAFWLGTWSTLLRRR